MCLALCVCVSVSVWSGVCAGLEVYVYMLGKACVHNGMCVCLCVCVPVPVCVLVSVYVCMMGCVCVCDEVCVYMHVTSLKVPGITVFPLNLNSVNLKLSVDTGSWESFEDLPSFDQT